MYAIRSYYAFLVFAHDLIPFHNPRIVLFCFRIQFIQGFVSRNRDDQQQLTPVTKHNQLLKIGITESLSYFGPLLKLNGMIA